MNSDYMGLQKVTVPSFTLPSVASLVEASLSAVRAILEHVDGDGCFSRQIIVKRVSDSLKHTSMIEFKCAFPGRRVREASL